MIDIAAAYGRVQERVAAAARAAGREPSSVRVVAVAKTKPAEMVRAAIDAGARIIGENYVQEARAKRKAVGEGAEWHFIGRLQRNKAREALELFDVVQTLDSLRLAQALDRLGRERGTQVRALIEVNVGGETTKGGVQPEALSAFVGALAPLEGLRVEGLMTIPPPQVDPSASRPFFRRLRELRDAVASVQSANAPLSELSMGMTDDFEEAIAEGATLVRVGRAIFGERSVQPRT